MKADIENGPDSWEPEGGFDTPDSDSNGVPIDWYTGLYAAPVEPTNHATDITR